jgi:hypothetical protein
MGGNFPGQV